VTARDRSGTSPETGKTLAPTKDAFDALRALLAVHETAEEMVIRPVTTDVAGESVAQARNQEELEANEVLSELERMDGASPDFEAQLAAFEKSVDEHAEAEAEEQSERSSRAR
jgi:hypothetical protein